HGSELLAVGGGGRGTGGLGRDRRAARPGLERLLLPRRVQPVYPRQERLIDERPLLRRTSHGRLLSAPARHDVAIGRPGPAPRLVALRRLAPGRHRVVALALALAATHRMVHRVHHGAAHRRAEAQPADAPRLADGHVLVVEVADLADRGHAVERDEPHLARRHLEGGASALLREQLCLGAGAPAQLGALPGLQLDRVDQRADRDVPHRQRVARQDVGLWPGHQRVPDLEPVRRDDVALLAVAVVEQREPRRAVRIVLDRHDAGRDAELLAAEVHLPQHPLRPAAAVAHRDPTVDVAAVRPPLRLEEALLGLLLRDLLVRDVREVAAGCGRRLDGSDPHDAQAPSTSSILWPGWSGTIAFFQSGRRPWKRPIRFSLPSNDAVRTEATLTLKTSSTARRISTLFASGRTLNATVFCSSFCRMLFSVMRGRIRIIRAGRLMARAPPPAPGGPRARTPLAARAGADRRRRATASRRRATAR